ncbi:hypothetical protein GJU39_05610 [Pedobacter petrophilus]|uniref:RNA polymerase sigma-70 region 2 domain-containing protein n=1 Tax=Pedobacter petrophilus TaxID=1908241 RepID=A0A7K0FVV9_9SPHI|nr:sigma factor [Pedobacter petrophilus]MRX75561.1 hypothetical protein [Pedobacter petrophilus]
MQFSFNGLKQQEGGSGRSIWLSDQEIFFESLRGHDPEAFRLLYKKYAAALFGLVLREVGDEPTAEIILEKIFLEVWTSITFFDETKLKIFSWLNQIAINQINRYYLNA